MDDNYTLKQINSILRSKVTEQAKYIIDLETQLNIVGHKDLALTKKIKGMALKAKRQRTEPR